MHVWCLNAAATWGVEALRLKRDIHSLSPELLAVPLDVPWVSIKVFTDTELATQTHICCLSVWPVHTPSWHQKECRKNDRGIHPTWVGLT